MKQRYPVSISIAEEGIIQRYNQKQQVVLGDDSDFFALLGSAPQELNTVRPEAKLT
jgi:hypothetical protein